MDVFTIADFKNQSFPFGREVFEDLQVLYHGTWSVYSPAIESGSFLSGELPFDRELVATIAQARTAIGLSSWGASDAFGSQIAGSKLLCMTGHFWLARAYATDGGGEIVRITLREATEFERLCTDLERRHALIARWKPGLKESPAHSPTIRVIELLEDHEAMQTLCDKVRNAKEAIQNLTKKGFPVVYAIRVHPSWFGDAWERYLFDRELGRRSMELRCSPNLISPDRIAAKALYPNGTDSESIADVFCSWADVEALLPK